jgi:hypothetical protein
VATTLKVRLDRKIPQDDGQTQLTFTADYEDGRNKEWAKYTPALSLSFVVKNEVEAASYEEGQTFTVTLDEAADDGERVPDPREGRRAQ